MLGGDTPADTGEVAVSGRGIEHWSELELAAIRSVLPQNAHLAFPFTVHEIVTLGLEAASRAGGGARERGMVTDALERVGMAHCAGRFYQTLSGGERQRVHLARVLCQATAPVRDGRPHWLFLDEPTANLDVQHQIAILDIARRWARDGGGVLAVLHDLNLAALYADRLIVMSQGCIAADGDPSAVLTDETLMAVFQVPLKMNRTPSGAPFVLPHSITLA